MRTWFITGCSTGLGRHLAQAVLAGGDRAAVTARHPEQVKDIVDGHGEAALALRLDVTDRRQVDEAIGRAEREFGGIDVLVNNAGIGYFAAVEEGEDAAIARLFDINFFGLVGVTVAALPGMRARRRGHVVNISSIAGIRSFPAMGYYNATKFAVEGVSEALRLEAEPLGIRVTLVEPSGFRTDWAGRSADESAAQIGAYESTAGIARRAFRANAGREPGDPQRAAAAIIRAVEADEPPNRLLLGNNACDWAMAKLDEMRAEFRAWEHVSRGADAPP